MVDQVKKPAPREEVTLKEVHTHGGKQRQPGDKIQVSPTQKEWLAKRKII